MGFDDFVRIDVENGLYGSVSFRSLCIRLQPSLTAYSFCVVVYMAVAPLIEAVTGARHDVVV